MTTLPTINITCEEHYKTRWLKRWKKCNHPATAMVALHHMTPNCQPITIALCPQHTNAIDHNLATMILQIRLANGHAHCLRCGQQLTKPEHAGTITKL